MKRSPDVKRKSSLPKRHLAALALASLLLAGCVSSGTGMQEDAGKTETAARVEPFAQVAEGGWPVDEVAAEVEPSVVQVNVEAIRTTPFGPREGRGLGSGVIYREDGYIITNNHVVEQADEVNVAFADGSIEEGEVVGTDPATELAVIKVNRGGLPAASFARSRNLVPGQLAVAVGSPSGFQSTVTVGVISGLNREIPADATGGRQERSLVDLIQTDAAISPGSSGGALADGNGRVVGINVAYLPPAQTGAVDIGFAIPSDTVISVADQIIEGGEAAHPYLGVSLSNLTPRIAERFGIPTESGALVVEVDPNGPADQAGVERGSVITAVGSEEVETTGDLLSALRDYRPGDSVELTMVDGGEERQVTVELGERG